MSKLAEEQAKALLRQIRDADPTVSSDAVTRLIADALQKARVAAIEEAAMLADPPLLHRKGALVLWRIRRIEIAERIRGLKAES